MYRTVAERRVHTARVVRARRASAEVRALRRRKTARVEAQLPFVTFKRRRFGTARINVIRGDSRPEGRATRHFLRHMVFRITRRIRRAVRDRGERVEFQRILTAVRARRRAR